MQVPLDFYRILGVPIQATPEQIKHAYGDRLQQLPRIQYSEVAISGRKQLLDEAYAVLRDGDRRSAYDGKAFAEIEAGGTIAELATPGISGVEIQDQQLPGALLLLHELGEYELVLKLTQADQGDNSAIVNDADICLTLALSYLELGREQWQKSQYEVAAQSLEAGLQSLVQIGLFPGIQAEIQAELHKLRPYRIIELLSQSPDFPDQRAQGLALLQEMLAAREGIDGTGNDQSGLSIEDFLKFIQQLRIYLRADEQQVLFEAEASRPSAVGSYLAVYALVAQGVQDRQPPSIRRARYLLNQLQNQQDIYLEQAICALLLGQTDAAQIALEQSQEYESIARIRELSPEDSPDWIPGLYHYTEGWLQEEVYPYFQDLRHQPVSLEAYFADEQVQTYLEALSPEGEDQVVLAAAPALSAPVNPESPQASSPAAPVPQPDNHPSLQQSLLALSRTLSLPPLSQWLPSRSSAPSGSALSSHSPRQPSRPSAAAANSRGQATREPLNRRHRKRQLQTLRNRRTQNSPTRTGLGLAGVVVVGVVSMALVAIAVLRQTQTQPENPALEQPQVNLAAPPLPIPSQVAGPPQAGSPGSSPALTQATARQVLQTWQVLKAQALGPEHQVGTLAEILTGEALTNWQARAQEGEANNWYWKYNLRQLQVERVEQQTPDRARVIATIRETANFYDRGTLQVGSSYTTPYRAEYELVREGGRWRIQGMQVQ